MRLHRLQSLIFACWLFSKTSVRVPVRHSAHSALDGDSRYTLAPRMRGAPNGVDVDVDVKAAVQAAMRAPPFPPAADVTPDAADAPSEGVVGTPDGQRRQRLPAREAAGQQAQRRRRQVQPSLPARERTADETGAPDAAGVAGTTAAVGGGDGGAGGGGGEGGPNELSRFRRLAREAPSGEPFRSLEAMLNIGSRGGAYVTMQRRPWDDNGEVIINYGEVIGFRNRADGDRWDIYAPGLPSELPLGEAHKLCRVLGVVLIKGGNHKLVVELDNVKPTSRDAVAADVRAFQRIYAKVHPGVSVNRIRYLSMEEFDGVQAS